MWLDRIVAAKKAQGITTKMMADKVKLPEDTIARILSGRTRDPRLETVLRLGAAVGLDAWEIFAETEAVLSSRSIAALESELSAVKATLLIAEQDIAKLATENADLKLQNTALSTELNHIKRETQLMEQIVEIHNYYMGKQ